MGKIITCPNCGRSVEPLLGLPLEKVECPGCGSRFALSDSLLSPETPEPSLPMHPLPSRIELESLDLDGALARMKSYVAPAIFVFVLYFFFWLPGFIANCIYLREAKQMQRVAGVDLPGVGCLAYMLAFWIVLFALFLAAFLIGVLPGSFPT